MADFNEIVRVRMEREGVNTGELHVSLIWNDIADLDLHVITPIFKMYTFLNIVTIKIQNFNSAVRRTHLLWKC